MEKTTIDFDKLPRTLNLPTKLALSIDIDNDYKFIYAYIEYRASRGYMWYKNETIAKDIGKSTRSVERALKALKEAKWIKIENRVKKGKMYHESFRRVIWIYSDYLVAKDKTHGYVASRPLEFKLFRERLFNAIADNTKISQIMHFIPMMDYLGEMQVNIDPSRDNPVYKYTKDALGRFKVLQTSEKEQEEILTLLYNFYKAQHVTKEEPQEALPPVEEKKEVMQDFGEFQHHIQKEYVDNVIVVRDNMPYTVNVMGHLMFDMGQNIDPIHLSGDEAIAMWQWLFSNQEEIKEKE